MGRRRAGQTGRDGCTEGRRKAAGFKSRAWEPLLATCLVFETCGEDHMISRAPDAHLPPPSPAPARRPDDEEKRREKKRRDEEENRRTTTTDEKNDDDRRTDDELV